LGEDIEVEVMPLAPPINTHEYQGVTIITRYFSDSRPDNPRAPLGWSYNMRIGTKNLFCAWCAGRYYGDSEDHAVNMAQTLIDRMGWGQE